MRHFKTALIVLALLVPAAALATGTSPLQPTSWGVVYDVPATSDVVLKADVAYLEDQTGRLTIDVYLPPKMAAGEKRPAVVFLNAIGDRGDEKIKHWGIYRTWPRLVAAHGLVGISMEADGERIPECLAGLFRFLATRGGEHGIDGSRIGVYAASANVSGATDYLLGDAPAPGVRAAVLYYGAPPTGRLRTDLPVLFIYAEGDLARWGGEELTSLWRRVIDARAPWTLMLASGLPHAFDAFSDRDEARRVVQQSIAFWKSQLEPVPQPPWQPSAARSIVEALYANDPQRAVDLLTTWLADHPDDTVARRERARSLQLLQRYPEAIAEYEKVIASGDDDPGGYAGLGQVQLGMQRFEEAARNFEHAIEGGVRGSQIYGQLAYAQLHLGRNADAVRNYEAAFAAGIPPGPNTRGLANYNLACGYARLGRVDDALDALARAVDEGFGQRAAWQQDPDLEPLRSSARYNDLVARLPEEAPDHRSE